MIDVSAIGQEHISNRAPVLVLAKGLKRDFLPEGEVRGGLLRSFAIGLAFLRAVDPAEADAFGFVVVQDFNGVAVDHGDDGPGYFRGRNKAGEECYEQ